MMTQREKTLMPLLLLMLAACGSRGGDCSASDTDWWVIEGCGGEELDSGFDSEDEECDEDEEECEEDDGDDDDDDEDGDDEDGALIFAELTLQSGQVSGGVVGYYEVSGGSVGCDAEHEVTAVQAASSCSACEGAWNLTLDEGWSEGDGCSAAGWPRSDGDVYKVGYAGETAYLHDGSGWQAVGEAEQTEEGLELWFHLSQ